MGIDSGISWTNHTWNPWRGCDKVSLGCEHCYMFRGAKRFGFNPGVVTRAAPATFKLPLSRNRLAGIPMDYKMRDGDKVFVCSWSDFFHSGADSWRDEAWQIIRQRPGLVFQILTKRPENIQNRLPVDWGGGWPNVWLGVTAENQYMADYRLPFLLDTPAAVRFVSVEPMLGPVDLDDISFTFKPGYFGSALKWHHLPSHLESLKYPSLDWVICGGESGPGARPIHPDWARSLRDQCVDAKVPFFFKQWGEWATVYDRDEDDPDWRACPRPKDDEERYVNLEGGHGFHGERVVFARRVGREAAGFFLDGREWKEMPQ